MIEVDLLRSIIAGILAIPILLAVYVIIKSWNM